MVSASKKGSLLMARNFIRMKAPAISSMIIAVIFVASRKESIRILRVSRRLTALITMAPKAPTPPASVGVNIPP